MRCLIVAALVAVCGPVSASETLTGPYAAQVLRVIDGDTVEARVRVWLGLDLTTLVRLRGIDTPELHGRCPGERAAAEAARDTFAALLATGPIRLSAITHDKFRGRIDAAIQLPNGSDAATILRATGHARPPRNGVSGCPVFRGPAAE